MEKITSKKELVENLKDVLSIEVVARNSYVNDMEIFHHPNVIRTIKKIKVDEDRHIALLEVLIRFLEDFRSKNGK